MLDQSNQLAKIGSWEVDLINRRIYWSDITKEIHEAEKDFLPNLEDRIDFYKEGEHRRKIREAVERSIHSGEPWDLELILVTVKGNERWVREIGKTDMVDGKPVRIYGSLQDIHSRKTAELHLQDRNRHIDAIASLNSSLLNYENWFEALESQMEVIGEAVKADRIYFFEYTFLEESGQNVVTMKMEWVRDGVKPEIDNPVHENLPVDEIRHFIDHLMYDGGYNEVVSAIKDKEFSVFLAEQDIKSILAIPVFTGKEFRGFIGFDDCTNERRWSEEEILFLKTIAINLGSAIENEDSEKRLILLNQSLEMQAKELASSNTELEQFAFVASHDLQEPLRMITSFLTQIERKYDDILDERGRKYIHFAVDGAMRMRQIIQDLLEYSRVGRVDVMREEVDLNTILENVKVLQRKVIEETKADVTWEPMPTIRANKGAMLHLFQNLIQNGLNYSKKGVQPELKIWSEESEKYWKFFVKDNGIGIDPEYNDQIFVIFQRLHAKEEYSGTGVGLAICKKIVENHGGKIGVDSEIGSGSIFYFTIEKSQSSL